MPLALGATKVRCKNHAAAALQHGFDRGNGEADSAVIGDPSVILLRNVEVRTNEHALAGHSRLVDPRE